MIPWRSGRLDLARGPVGGGIGEDWSEAGDDASSWVQRVEGCWLIKLVGEKEESGKGERGLERME